MFVKYTKGAILCGSILWNQHCLAGEGWDATVPTQIKVYMIYWNAEVFIICIDKHVKHSYRKINGKVSVEWENTERRKLSENVVQNGGNPDKSHSMWWKPEINAELHETMRKYHVECWKQSGKPRAGWEIVRTIRKSHIKSWKSSGMIMHTDWWKPWGNLTVCIQ